MRDVRLIRFVNLAKTIARAQALSRSGDETTKRRYAELIAAGRADAVIQLEEGRIVDREDRPE